jgi:hypothetical protein
MDTEYLFKTGSVSFFNPGFLAKVGVLVSFLLSACGGNGTPPPPTMINQTDTPSFVTLIPTETPTPTYFILYTPTAICISGLTFINDVTIPDFSIMAPGTSLDKQWLVQDSGSCNWDNRYRIRLIAGDGMGASPEQALFPARSGTQATLRIIFTAPNISGQYLSEWQAFDPLGVPFGDTFFIKIIVQ